LRRFRGAAFGRKHRRPVLCHVDDGPAALRGLVPGLVELSDLGLPVVGIFAGRIGVMDDADEARSAALQTATALMAAKPIRNPRRMNDARETSILDLTGASE